MKFRFYLLGIFYILFCNVNAQQKYIIHGILTEQDSISPIPFAYVINISTGNGALCNYDGKFSIVAGDNDSLSFSYLGYLKRTILVKNIKNLNDSVKSFLNLVLLKNIFLLKTYDVYDFKIKPYEREYMNRVINRPRITGINSLESPISALYDAFSRKGKANRKLASLYEQMLIDELVEKKFNPEILRRLTGDEKIDFEKFRRYCYNISDQFIIMNDGYDLYAPIMERYRKWKKEGR
jgi:hypothetical protein